MWDVIFLQKHHNQLHKEFIPVFSNIYFSNTFLTLSIFSIFCAKQFLFHCFHFGTGISGSRSVTKLARTAWKEGISERTSRSKNQVIKNWKRHNIGLYNSTWINLPWLSIFCFQLLARQENDQNQILRRQLHTFCEANSVRRTNCQRPTLPTKGSIRLT